MPGFTVLGLDDAYLASIGSFLDAFTLVRRQVAAVHEETQPVPMETPILLLSPGGRPVRLAGGRRLDADAGVDDSQHLDLVHVAAFVVGDAGALDARLAGSGKVCDWLRRQHAEGAIVSASGAAIFLLAEAGLLGGGPAAVPRVLTPLFRARYPRIRVEAQQPTTETGRVLTSSGLASDPLLLTRLVELCTSSAMARWVGEVSGLQRVWEEQLAEDTLVANAQLWLEKRYAQNVRIADLARELAVSPQTLIRRFRSRLDTTPHEYLQRLRVEAAQIMLRRTGRHIEQIAAQVGYSDTSSFRAVFRAHTGMSASHYRAASRTSPGPKAGTRSRKKTAGDRP